MKKILLIALVFILLFTSVACDFENDQSENDTAETITTTGITTTAPYTNDPSGFIVDFGPYVIRSYEEYLNYVELVNQYLPDDFIYYDQISRLGEFYGFQNLMATSNWPPEKHDERIEAYIYELYFSEKDPIVALQIESCTTTDWIKGYEIPDTYINSRNLRLLLDTDEYNSEEISGIYRTRNCIYWYNNGKLTDIYCQVGSSMLWFSGVYMSELWEISLDAGPIVLLFDESMIDAFFNVNFR